jgi:hypothetical protein
MTHKIPVGQHVLVSIDEESDNGCWVKGTAELIVIGHTFDCDSTTPLYHLCSEPIKTDCSTASNIILKFRCPLILWFQMGMGEGSLRPIEGKISEMKYSSPLDYLRTFQASLQEFAI